MENSLPLFTCFSPIHKAPLVLYNSLVNLYGICMCAPQWKAASDAKQMKGN